MRLGERFGAAKCIGTRLNCMAVNGEMPNHDAQMHRQMALRRSAGLGNVPGERQGAWGCQEAFGSSSCRFGIEKLMWVPLFRVVEICMACSGP